MHVKKHCIMLRKINGFTNCTLYLKIYINSVPLNLHVAKIRYFILAAIGVYTTLCCNHYIIYL